MKIKIGSALNNFKKLYANGGPGNGKPATMVDSIMVMNNAQKVADYYKKYKIDDKFPLRSETWFDPTSYGSYDGYTKGSVETFKDYAGDRHTDKGSERNIGNVPLNSYYNKLDDNRSYIREAASGILDTRSPMTLLDRRIAPQYQISASNNMTGDPLKGDNVSLFTYDPLAVKPYIMLTEAEKKEREDKYGTSGFPASYKNSNSGSKPAPITTPLVKTRPDLSLPRMPIKSAELTYNSGIPIQKVPEMKADTMGSERYVPFTANNGNPNLPQGYWDKGMGKKETQYAQGGQLPRDDKTKTYTNKAEYDKALQAYNEFAAGGNFTPYGSSSNPYGQLTPMQPNYPTSVGNNYVSSASANTPTPSAPNMKAPTMGTSGNSKPGVSDIAGYAGMANTALSMFNTTQNDDYMMGNDAAVSGVKDGVKQVPVAGQFVALGDTSSDMLYQQASKTSGLESQAWAGAAGTVSPSSGWEKKNEMYKSGEIDSTEFGISTLAHFVMPGLDTMYLQGKHNDYVDAGKKVESNLKDNQQFYQNNIGAYDAQMSSTQGKQFGKGGSNPNVWTLMDDSNPLAYGGQMTTEYKTGGTHEQNPNGGIPIGNSLVEEGEIRFDYLENKQPKSYIFSNRIKFKK